jgi:hypothetical protein
VVKDVGITCLYEDYESLTFLPLQAIELAKQNAENRPQEGRIFRATYAVVFLGTPHRGSQQAGWGVIATNVCKAMLKDTNTSVLRSLEQDSEVLERISEAFERIMTRGEVKVHSFVEEIPTLGIGKVFINIYS